MATPQKTPPKVDEVFKMTAKNIKIIKMKKNKVVKT